MRGPMLFVITNYLGFSKEVIIWCNSEEEGRGIIERTEEYPPMKIEAKGYIFFDLYETIRNLREDLYMEEKGAEV